jgi:hypothetical protein
MSFAKDKEVSLGSIDEPLMSGNALRKSIRKDNGLMERGSCLSGQGPIRNFFELFP